MCRVYGKGDINERSSKGQVVSNFQQHPICMNEISNYSSRLAVYQWCKKFKSPNNVFVEKYSNAINQSSTTKFVWKLFYCKKKKNKYKWTIIARKYNQKLPKST